MILHVCIFAEKLKYKRRHKQLQDIPDGRRQDPGTEITCLIPDCAIGQGVISRKICDFLFLLVEISVGHSEPMELADARSIHSAILQSIVEHRPSLQGFPP